jgi:hypothetical protein
MIIGNWVERCNRKTVLSLYRFNPICCCETRRRLRYSGGHFSIGTTQETVIIQFHSVEVFDVSFSSPFGVYAH